MILVLHINITKYGIPSIRDPTVYFIQQWSLIKTICKLFLNNIYYYIFGFKKNICINQIFKQLITLKLTECVLKNALWKIFY